MPANEILFAGDPHGDFDPIIEAVQADPPAAVVILGDMGAERPLDEVLASVQQRAPVYWIIGNHDSDREVYYDALVASGLADSCLDGRIVTIGGARIAGLGGVFRGKVWRPGGAEHYHTRAEWLRFNPRTAYWRGGLPLKHRSSIFPEDFDALRDERADVLVTHEAPGCHSHGFVAFDNLARRLGARFLLHGHIHEHYTATLDCGITVQGVGLARIVRLPISSLTGAT